MLVIVFSLASIFITHRLYRRSMRVAASFYGAFYIIMLLWSLFMYLAQVRLDMLGFGDTLLLGYQLKTTFEFLTKAIDSFTVAQTIMLAAALVSMSGIVLVGSFMTVHEVVVFAESLSEGVRTPRSTDYGGFQVCMRAVRPFARSARRYLEFCRLND